MPTTLSHLCFTDLSVSSWSMMLLVLLLMKDNWFWLWPDTARRRCSNPTYRQRVRTLSSVHIVISPSDHQMLCCGGAPAESRQDQTVQIQSLRMILGTSPGSRGIKQENTKLKILTCSCSSGKPPPPLLSTSSPSGSSTSPPTGARTPFLLIE